VDNDDYKDDEDSNSKNSLYPSIFLTNVQAIDDNIFDGT
jgi:hypothetical protein